MSGIFIIFYLLLDAENILYFIFNKTILVLGNKYLDCPEERVDVEENLSLSAFIFAVSLFLVSENCVAMTTRQRFIMKNDPI